MTAAELYDEIKGKKRYNLHSHTEFCDGRVPLSEMARAAAEAGMEVWGISPHSPLNIASPCNMSIDDVPAYLEETSRLKKKYDGKMKVHASMEVDYIGPEFGPHIDLFQEMPLDYRIGSVHFVPNQEGVWLDCDGRYERFAEYLRTGFRGDLRYVVETYFNQVLTMLDLGGFELIGHFDKIIGNAIIADPTLEDQEWYRSLIEEIVAKAKQRGVVVEINTKAYFDKNRFFPSERFWPLLLKADIPLAVNSDAHYPEKVNLGRAEAFGKLNKIGYFCRMD